MAALKAAHNDEAIAEFKKEIELDPASAQGYFGLGVAYMQSKDYAAAIAPLKKALELDPNLTAVDKSLSYALLTAGYAAEAIPHFQKSGDKAGLGIAELQTGDLLNAVQNLQGALAERPNDPDLMYYLARATGLLSKELTDDLIAEYPDSPRADLAAAENYAALRQEQDAEAKLSSGVEAEARSAGRASGPGPTLRQESKWKEAEAGVSRGGEAGAGQCRSGLPAGRWRCCKKATPRRRSTELERANRLLPDMPETSVCAGQSGFAGGNPAAAEKAWKHRDRA